MAAFLLVDVSKVHDEQAYGAYRERVAATLVRAGGQYLARGGAVEVLEGTWHPNRVVVVRFESPEAARRWWSGPDYSELKAMRQRSTDTNMILVEGLRGE